MSCNIQKKLDIALTVIFILFATISCKAETRITASKNYVTKNVTVGNFISISTSSIIDIEYSQGPQSVKIYAPDNVIPYVEVAVTDGLLKARFNAKDISIQGNATIKIIISSPNVSMFRTSGTGNLTITSDLRLSSPLDMKTSGTGDLSFKSISSPSATITTTGSGNVEGDNLTANSTITLNANGTGDVSIDSLSCKSLGVRATGSTSIKVQGISANFVDASATGTGGISLSGNTQSAMFKASGSGDIIANKLLSKSTTAIASGVGNIKCHASETIDATRNGSGEIGYAGNPKNIFKKSNRR